MVEQDSPISLSLADLVDLCLREPHCLVFGWIGLDQHPVSAPSSHADVTKPPVLQHLLQTRVLHDGSLDQQREGGAGGGVSGGVGGQEERGKSFA